MKKVLWFSRHQMTPEQEAALGKNVTINQVSRSINSAFELQEEINEADIIAVVAPINLQEQFLRLANGKPVITAVSKRELIPQEGGEDKVVFNFVKWEQLEKIEVVKHDYIPE